MAGPLQRADPVGPLLAVHHGDDAPCGLAARRWRVHVVGGRLKRLGVQARRRRPHSPVHVEGDVCSVALQQPPAEMHAPPFGGDGHETAIQPFANLGGRPPEGDAGLVQRIHRIEAEIRRDLVRRQLSQGLVVAGRRRRRCLGRRGRGRLLRCSERQSHASRDGKRPNHGSLLVVLSSQRFIQCGFRLQPEGCGCRESMDRLAQPSA